MEDLSRLRESLEGEHTDRESLRAQMEQAMAQARAEEERQQQEARELFDNIFNLRQFPSGRTLWVGGTAVSENYPMSNFNCSFTSIETWEDLSELFYLLMLGSGVGFKCTPEMAAHLAPIRLNTRLILSEYNRCRWTTALNTRTSGSSRTGSRRSTSGTARKAGETR